jgi:cysteine-rich secretory family protein
MQSQGHRDNMMSPAYNTVGIGVYCAPDGTLWATQDFGRLSSSGPGYAAPSAPATPFVRRDGGGPGC